MLHKYKRKEADVLSEKGQLKSLSFGNWKTCQLNDELEQKYKIFSKGNVCVNPCALPCVAGSKELLILVTSRDF